MRQFSIPFLLLITSLQLLTRFDNFSLDNIGVIHFYPLFSMFSNYHALLLCRIIYLFWLFINQFVCYFLREIYFSLSVVIILFFLNSNNHFIICCMCHTVSTLCNFKTLFNALSNFLHFHFLSTIN